MKSGFKTDFHTDMASNKVVECNTRIGLESCMANRLTTLRVLVCLVISCFCGGGESSETAIPPLHEVLTNYCVDCHGSDAPEGDLDLDSLLGQDIVRHTATWERVLRKLSSRQMPPSGEVRPTEDVVDATVKHLTSELDAAAEKYPQPGRTDTFRRLNRVEYQNAIRDLLALDIDAETLLPADESSHGFDNVTVGDLPPTLLARYINAAQKISRLAIGAPRKNLDGHTFRIAPDVTQEKHVPGLRWEHAEGFCCITPFHATVSMRCGFIWLVIATRKSKGWIRIRRMRWNFFWIVSALLTSRWFDVTSMTTN